VKKSREDSGNGRSIGVKSKYYVFRYGTAIVANTRKIVKVKHNHNSTKVSAIDVVQLGKDKIIVDVAALFKTEEAGPFMLPKAP